MELKLRRCSLCHFEKPASRDFFHVNKHAKDGSFLRTECISCRTGNPKRVQDKNVYKSKTERMDAYWNRSLLTVRGAINYLWWNSISFKHRRSYGFDSDLNSDYLEGLWNAQGGRCYWTGVLLKVGRQASDRHPQKMSLDRLDNNKGYVRGNVVWASRFANCGRGELGVEEFKLFLSSVRESVSGERVFEVLPLDALKSVLEVACLVKLTRRTPGTSKFRGVSWHKRQKKWVANLRVLEHGKSILRFLGSFDDEEMAAKAYEDAARGYFKNVEQNPV